MTSLPAYVDVELWAAYIEQRKAMKVPFTQQAQKLVIRRLMKMHSEGWDVNASLEKSAIYGYRGVFEVARLPVTTKDPALVKLDDDARKAAPIPLAVLEQMAKIRQGARA